MRNVAAAKSDEIGRPGAIASSACAIQMPSCLLRSARHGLDSQREHCNDYRAQQEPRIRAVGRTKFLRQKKNKNSATKVTEFLILFDTLQTSVAIHPDTPLPGQCWPSSGDRCGYAKIRIGVAGTRWAQRHEYVIVLTVGGD